MRKVRHYLPLVLISLFLVSCEKKESAIELPPKGSAIIDRTDMGEDYHDQVFYDFDKGQAVYTSLINSWDLAFEASPKGYHVFINGGKDMWLYNTHTTDISAVLQPPAIKNNEWSYDMPCGLPDSTGIGEWVSGNLSKKEVYILKLNPAYDPDTFKKIMLVNYSADSYLMVYGDLRMATTKSIVIPKDSKYSLAYFSFDNGGQVVYPDPPKDSWDIVFTRYRYIYRNLNNFPYLVTGVLLNPYNTTAAFVDSTTTYDKISYVNVPLASKFTNARDVIGFEWKSYDIPAGKYTVNKNKVYVLKDTDGKFWKLHFLDFYNSAGIKGSPSFEYERLQ